LDIKCTIQRFVIYEINILKITFLLLRKLDIKIRRLNQCQMKDKSNDRYNNNLTVVIKQ